MTNKEDESDSCETRLAALLAVHLVSQVLDEAYGIANAATESGQPWSYLEMIKGFRSAKLCTMEEKNLYYCASKDDIETETNETTEVTNVIATSTPQKIVADESVNKMNNYIGQGDEELSISNMQQMEMEMNNSTSIFINNLFDMSEVERVIICDDTELIETNQGSNVLLTEAMTKIMESYVNTALGNPFGLDINQNESLAIESLPSVEHSGYTFLTDALAIQVENVVGDVAFCADEKNIEDENIEAMSSVIVNEVTQCITEAERKVDKNDVARYEDAFLTLNRDYDQCSEEDNDPILQDPKGMLMQDVELEASPTPDDNVVTNETKECKNKELSATSAVSATASSRKSSLVQRCRTQGARLLACLRGWWRRKTPGRRKEARIPGSVRGLCPLSPDARRRAVSLLDESRLGSSIDSAQHVIWKFNTVSEAFVNSSRWKNYTFESNHH